MRAVALLVATFGALAAHATAPIQSLVYDARVGWLEAGTLAINMVTNGESYELHGSVRTSGPIERFFRWRGQFAAVGTLDGDVPSSSAYLLIEDRKERRKVTLATGGKTTIHRVASASREIEHPRGSDLMSVLFLSNGCFDSRWVHDGEDAYRVTLSKRTRGELRQGEGYAQGEAVVCHYDFLYESGEHREVEVWLTESEGRTLPAKIRVRVPFRPDGVLKLRMPRALDQTAAKGL